MREIKFRAWADGKIWYPHKDRKDWWFFGAEGHWSLNHGNIIEKILCDSVESENTVLMQYTGLKDKKGKETYEGDIVECCFAYGGIFKAEIVFQDGCFEIQEPRGRDGVFRDYLNRLARNHAVSVIGNIYENPGLLK